MVQGKEKEGERFIRFIKRLQDEGLGGMVGIININPKTNEASILKIKDKKNKEARDKNK